MKRCLLLWLGGLLVVTGCTTSPAAAPVPLEGNATWYITESKRLTASHPELPLGTRVRVTNLLNDRKVIVTITGQIPRKGRWIIHIAQEAAKNIQMNPRGPTPVRLEVLGGRWPMPDSILGIGNREWGLSYGNRR